MSDALPTKTELEKLPLRAIAAYSARSACRLSGRLRGLVPDETINVALNCIQAVWQSGKPSDMDVGSLMKAVADLYGAARNVPDLSAHIVVVCISQSAQVAKELITADRDPTCVDHYLHRAAKKAEEAVSVIDDLDTEPTATRTAAIGDYEILLNTYGLHDEASIGDLVDCFTD